MFEEIQLHKPSGEPLAVDLADGRVVFFPEGRDGAAYFVNGHAQARSIEGQLAWARAGANVAALVVIGVSVWLQDFRVLAFVLPAVIAPFVAGRMLVWGLVEVSDPVALRNAGARTSSVSPLFPLAGICAMAVAFYIFRDRFTTKTVLQVLFGSTALLVVFLQWLRRERVRRGREFFRLSETPDNKPIIPR